MTTLNDLHNYKRYSIGLIAKHGLQFVYSYLVKSIFLLFLNSGKFM